MLARECQSLLLDINSSLFELYNFTITYICGRCWSENDFNPTILSMKLISMSRKSLSTIFFFPEYSWWELDVYSSWRKELNFSTNWAIWLTIFSCLHIYYWSSWIPNSSLFELYNLNVTQTLRFCGKFYGWEVVWRLNIFLFFWQAHDDYS